ncbi:response regulator transcription factor [Ferrovibrio sp.]|uniref:response regulator transcription factor n=1 Tax=Ferrovibrio sp. TaxID=1917215 RepID=UPI0025C678FD|nr:response regulator transcription factor [Ferrovibrio sp.]MBX3453711.1 response regulator transcription factor [Ferrovibrio sp.]
MTATDGLVYIIDDDPYIRESLQELLRSVGRRAWTFETTQKFIASDRPDEPSCLVLDVRLPGRSGLEFQRDLRDAGIQIPIIFITGHGDVPMSVAAMKAGALEFLTKPFRDQEFLDAVDRAIRIDSECRGNASILGELRDRYDELTSREREVLALVVQGKLNKQVAAELGLSEITVKVHRSNVMRKMRAQSLPDLVRFTDRLNAQAKGIG